MGLLGLLDDWFQPYFPDTKPGHGRIHLDQQVFKHAVFSALFSRHAGPTPQTIATS